jgi:uncharacterized membrane protein
MNTATGAQSQEPVRPPYTNVIMDSLFSGAHFHLLVNHVPIIGVFFALALLVVSYFYSGDVLRRTALVVLVVTALSAAASAYSGDAAEEAIRGFPGVHRDQIHAHENMADKAYLASAILAVAAIGVLIRWRRTPVPGSATLVILIGTAIVSGLMAYTGLLGGQVRHSEVRPGAVPGDATVIEPPRARRLAPAPAP